MINSLNFYNQTLPQLWTTDWYRSNHNKCFFTFVVTSSLISSTTAGIHDMRQRSRRVG